MLKATTRLKILDHIERWGRWTLRWVVPHLVVYVAWFVVINPNVPGLVAALSEATLETKTTLVQFAGFLWLLLLVARSQWRRYRWGSQTLQGALATPFTAVATKDDPTFPPQRCARHEAAHAVAGTWAGETITDLNIFVSGDVGGTCRSALRSDTPIQDAAFSMMVLALAGNRVDQEQGYRDVGSCSDVQTALRAAATIISTGVAPKGYEGALCTDGLIRAAGMAVTDALGRFGDVVEDITLELLAHPDQPLNGERLRELLDPVVAGRSLVPEVAHA